MNPQKRRSDAERGFVLVWMAVMAVGLIAVLGLAVDIGRMFVAKHEAQIFTDSGSLAAALKLDGTPPGATSASAAVDSNANNWNFGTQAFTGTSASHTTTFSNSLNGPWVTAPSVPVGAGYQYVKVTASVTVPLYFIGIVVPRTTTTVNAVSISGQIPTSSLSEGAFPFAPMAFPGATTNKPTIGFTVGQQYTIRYPSSPKAPPCAGDVGQHSRDASDRGYWGDNSASTIAQRIVDDYQNGAIVTIGQAVNLTGGAKTTDASYLDERAGQDTDTNSTTLAGYAGNGRRLVVMPITDYNAGVALGFAEFLLLPPGNYGHTGNSAWCAIFVGPWVQGSPRPGAAGSPGAYLVRLLQ